MNEFQVFKAGPKEVSSRSKYCRTFVNPKDTERKKNEWLCKL